MNKRVLSLTLLLVCFSLVMQAEGRIVEPFNSGWVFKKAPAGKELAEMGEWMDRGRDSSHVECKRYADTV